MSFEPIQPSGLYDNILCLLHEAVFTDISYNIISKAFNNTRRGVYENIATKIGVNGGLLIYNTSTNLTLCLLQGSGYNKTLVFFQHSTKPGSDVSAEALFDILLCLTDRKAFNSIIQGYRKHDKAVLVCNPITGMVEVKTIEDVFVDFIGEINLDASSEAYRNLQLATQENKWRGLLFRKAGMRLIHEY